MSAENTRTAGPGTADLPGPGAGELFAPLENTRIELPGLANLRDLGGYPGRDGTVVAPGRLFRSEVLVTEEVSTIHGVWSAANAEQLAGLGIRTIIDLRARHEVAKTPSSWREATGAAVVELPIAEGGEGTDTNYVRGMLTGEITHFTELDMAHFYRETLDRRADIFAAAIRILADSAQVPALVHCSAGKDRTGLLIALVLEVLGSPRALTVADYTLTGLFRPNRVQAYAPLFEGAGVNLDDIRVLFETPASAMTSALSYLDEQFGGAAHYLVSAGGISPVTLDRLKTSLLIMPEQL